jgi:uncharacterized repeat protein (TIGR03837 family)
MVDFDPGAPAVNDIFAVDIFCRVVDNYGDLGVVLRLAKAVSAAAPGLELRLIVDDLDTLRKLCPKVNPREPVQKIESWTLVRWDHPWEGFARRQARLVIESLACGRPAHYDTIFYDPAGTERVLHINLEHLTAEDYAEEFHRLPSVSPLSRIKKHFFLPGFTPKTGGLLLDPAFLERKRVWNSTLSFPLERRRRSAGWGISLSPGTEDLFWVLVFAYDGDFTGLVRDLSRWERPKLVLLAEGAFRGGFLSSWEKAGKPFPVLTIPFLPMEDWDDLLLACDLSLVRGEETLSRAALGGRPFLWQAYRLNDGYQRVKVAALVDRMQGFFADSDVYNGIRGGFDSYNTCPPGKPEEETYLDFFRVIDAVVPGFRNFANSLESNGDLAKHLLSFMDDII